MGTQVINDIAAHDTHKDTHKEANGEVQCWRYPYGNGSQVLSHMAWILV